VGPRRAVLARVLEPEPVVLEARGFLI
jgi:hypothetical protein